MLDRYHQIPAFKCIEHPRWQKWLRPLKSQYRGEVFTYGIKSKRLGFHLFNEYLRRGDKDIFTQTPSVRLEIPLPKTHYFPKTLFPQNSGFPKQNFQPKPIPKTQKLYPLIKRMSGLPIQGADMQPKKLISQKVKFSQRVTFWQI